MANWCYETVWLHGSSEKVSEVVQHIKDQKIPESEFKNGFCSKTFPESVCEILSNNKIFLETKWGPAFKEICELSKNFTDVGFYSSSCTEGYCDDIAYILRGSILYSVHYENFSKEEWEKVTNSKMCERGYFNYRRKLKIE